MFLSRVTLSSLWYRTSEILLLLQHAWALLSGMKMCLYAAIFTTSFPMTNSDFVLIVTHHFLWTCYILFANNKNVHLIIASRPLHLSIYSVSEWISEKCPVALLLLYHLRKYLQRNFSKCSGVSLTNNRNNRGPNTEPCSMHCFI